MTKKKLKAITILKPLSTEEQNRKDGICLDYDSDCPTMTDSQVRACACGQEHRGKCVYKIGREEQHHD